MLRNPAILKAAGIGSSMNGSVRAKAWTPIIMRTWIHKRSRDSALSPRSRSTRAWRHRAEQPADSTPPPPPPVHRTVVFKHAQKMEQLVRKDRIADALRSILLEDKADGLLKDLAKQQRKYPARVQLSSATSKDKLPLVPKRVLARPRVWNVVLNAMAEYGMFEHVFKLMRRQFLATPNADTYTSMFKSCARQLEQRPPYPGLLPEKIEPYMRALNLYRNMELHKEPLHRYHINLLLKCCSRARDWETMFKLYQNMNRVHTPRRRQFSGELQTFMQQWRKVEKRKRKMDASDGFAKAGEVIRSTRMVPGASLSIDGEIQDDTAPVKASSDADEQWLMERLDGFLRATVDPSFDASDLEEDAKLCPENAQSSETEESKLIYRIRPDAVTYSTLLNACAARGGEAAYQDACAIWKELQDEVKEANEQTKAARSAYMQAQAKKEAELKNASRKKSLKNKATRRGASAVSRQRVDVELTEEEMTAWKEQESLTVLLDQELPLVEMDVKLVNAMLFVCRNAGTREAYERSFSIASEQMGAAFRWLDFVRYFQNVLDEEEIGTNGVKPAGTKGKGTEGSSTSKATLLLEDFPFEDNNDTNLGNETIEETAVAGTDSLSKLSGNPFYQLLPALCPTPDVLQDYKNRLLAPHDSSSLQPDAQTLTLLLDILKKLNASASTFRTFYHFFTRSTGSQYRFYQTVKPDTALQLFYLEYLVNQGNQAEATALFQQLRAQGPRNFTIPPPAEAYAHMIRMAWLEKDAELGKQYWQELVTWSNRVATSTLAKWNKDVYRPSGKALFNYVRSLRATGNAQDAVDQLYQHAKHIQTVITGGKNPLLWQDRFAMELVRKPEVWKQGVDAAEEALKNADISETARQKLLDHQKEFQARYEYAMQQTGTTRNENKLEKAEKKSTGVESAEQHALEEEKEDLVNLPAGTLTNPHTPRWLLEKFPKLRMENSA